MNPAIREAIEAADQWCPCAHIPHRGNICCGDGECDLATCKYPGHAAIRNLARVVLEEAANVPDEWTRHPSCEPGTICTHIRMGTEVAGRIRALMPEEQP